MFVNFNLLNVKVIPILSFSAIYPDGRQKETTLSRSSDPQIDILRFTLIVLILSIVWFIFNPIWFPQAELKYDFSRFFLLGVASLATVVTYRTYKRKLKDQ